MVSGLSGGIQAKASGLVFDSAHQPGLAEPSATQLYDYSRYRNHGTFLADGHPDWVQLPSGLWVMRFDGDYVDCGADRSLNPTTAITLEVWCNPDTVGTKERDIISKHWVSEAFILRILKATSKWTFQLYDGAWTNISSDSVITLGGWTHVVGTWELSATSKLCVNGVLQAAEGVFTGPIAVSTNPLVIGQEAGKVNAEPFDGDIALPRIYHRALSVGEALKHYTAEKAGFGL